MTDLKNLRDPKGLIELARKAMEAFNALPPERQAELRWQQRRSYVIGEMRMSNPDMTLEEANALYLKVDQTELLVNAAYERGKSFKVMEIISNDEEAEAFIRKCEHEVGKEISADKVEEFSGRLAKAYERGRQAALPAGCMIVPIEPTAEMMRKGMEASPMVRTDPTRSGRWGLSDVECGALFSAMTKDLKP